MTTTTPLRALSRILVKPLPPDEKTKGGIVVPDNAQQPKDEGIVVAVNRWFTRGDVAMEPSVKVGDHVIYSRFMGSDFRFEGVKYHAIHDENLFAVIES